MDMRLDEGRDRQPTLGVDIPGVGGLHRGLGGDARIMPSCSQG
jgi:hypothetical protein